MTYQVSPEIVEALARLGVDATALDCRDGPRIVVVQASLDEAKKALGESPRDHVVMARVDADTAADLDRWVDVGLAKSRSEAAALFLREGLHLRQRDLDRLSGALDQFTEARDRLKREAAAVLGVTSPNN